MVIPRAFGSKSKRKPNKNKKSLILEDYVLLHIGKTGGTSIGRFLRKFRKDGQDIKIKKVGHRITLQRVLEESPSCKVGFVIREPSSRFVSGFNSRLRSGRPAHHHTWSTDEAVAFSYFPTANDLAEALVTDDERMRSAAEFAMQAIGHLRRGYAFHLGGVAPLKEAADRIYCVAELEHLNDDVFRLLEPAGLSREQIAETFQTEHQAPSKGPALSEKAIDNLKTFWRQEYRIYDYCRKHLVRR